MSIRSRGMFALNTLQFGCPNGPEDIGPLQLSPPAREQHILRMLIRRPFDGLCLPHALQWVLPLIGMAETAQSRVAAHPFLYLTVRNGVVRSEGDDQWHVDGFSMQYSHLPEQNYIWCDRVGTEFYDGGIPIPSDFDPMTHNLHWFIQERVEEGRVRQAVPQRVYALDPYVIHRRPPETKGDRRCFVRLSYTPIEIADVNNTLNPAMPTNYTRDGVCEFRNSLGHYAGFA